MSTPRHLPPEALNDWLAAVAAELDLDPDTISIRILLNVARDVAHDVARPAAPLSTFLMGIALGREMAAATEAGTEEGSDVAAASRAELTRLAERLTRLAAEWSAARESDAPAAPDGGSGRRSPE